MLIDNFKNSVDLSILAYNLTKRNTSLCIDADLARLAGIMFNLGCLPVISYFEKHSVTDAKLIVEAISALRSPLNKLILSKWGINLDLAGPISKHHLTKTNHDLGDVLLVIKGFLQKDTSLLQDGDTFVQRIWVDLEKHHQDDLKEAIIIKNMLNFK